MMVNLDLEQKVVKLLRSRGRSINLEKDLLIVSGVPEVSIDNYLRNIDDLQFDIHSDSSLFGFSGLDKLKAVQSHPWKGGRKLYPEGKNAEKYTTLADALDGLSNFNDERRAASCNGLTSLTSVLANREGLKQNLLISQNHVKGITSHNNCLYEIENTIPNGIREIIRGSDKHKDITQNFFVAPVDGLVASTLQSRAVREFKASNFDVATELFNLAYQASENVSPLLAGMALAGQAYNLGFNNKIGEADSFLSQAEDLGFKVEKSQPYTKLKNLLAKKMPELLNDEEHYEGLIELGLESHEIYKGLYDVKKALGKEMEARRCLKRALIDYSQ